MSRYPNDLRILDTERKLESVEGWPLGHIVLKRLSAAQKTEPGLLIAAEVLETGLFPVYVMARKEPRKGPLISTYDSVESLLDAGWVTD